MVINHITIVILLLVIHAMASLGSGKKNTTRCDGNPGPEQAAVRSKATAFVAPIMDAT